MEICNTKLRGVKIITPIAHGDNRGWFMETYNKADFDKAGLDYVFVQDNQSFSAQKNILRGLHFQNNPYAQAKLVRCTRGKILDVAVDIRRGSPTFLEYVAVELSEENHKQLMIPRGFAHGFVTLTEDVMVQYKVDNVYNKEADRGISYKDLSIGVDWGVETPILSQKDSTSPCLVDSDANFTIKVLVTGVNGQLGYDVVKRLNALGIECKGADKADFDISDFEQTRNYIKTYNPDVVVHCAAYTAVDKAEDEQEICRKINVVGSENIAKVCKEIDSSMVYISTDYVYDGKGDLPFKVEDTPNPQNVYGLTKLQGEESCRAILDKLYVVRTSWVFGINGNNFVKTMLKLAQNHDHISVVGDQIGSPTYTVDLAEFICYILQTQKYGIYNCSNEGYCSWYDFAQAIFKKAGVNVQVDKVTSKEYPAKAKRPLNSRMDKSKLTLNGYHVMPSWENALERYLEEMNK